MSVSTRISIGFMGTACAALLLWITMPSAVVSEETRFVQEKHESNEEHAEGEGREHDEHGEDEVVRLSPEEMKEFGVVVAEAGPGKLQVYVDMPGEVVIDPDRLAHVVPRVGGVVRQVRKKLGDMVRTGEILAEIDSRELSALKSGYLVARERVELAASTFAREEKLWRDEISSEREYLEAKQALAEGKIEMHAAQQKLHALGFPEEYLKGLTFANDELFTRYEIVAPFNGQIIEKHITHGEMVKDDAEAFVIADLSSVWVVMTVYQKDLPHIDLGQEVLISIGDSSPALQGTISYISPVVDEATRTTRAHVVMPNPDGRWRPGSFVRGKVSVEEVEVPLLVRRSAVQIVEGKPSVFVKTDEGFEPHPVDIGREDEHHVEISTGLSSGDRYVESGAFTLKAELAKGGFGDGHGH